MLTTDAALRRIGDTFVYPMPFNRAPGLVLERDEPRSPSQYLRISR